MLPETRFASFLRGSSHNEHDNLAPQNESRNSALERACRVMGCNFEKDYDIDAEVQRAMKGDFSQDKDCAIRENPNIVDNSSVFIKTNKNQCEIEIESNVIDGYPSA